MDKHETAVKIWFSKRMGKFVESVEDHYMTIPNIANELRAIADEADFRLSNPNWPSNE